MYAHKQVTMQTQCSTKVRIFFLSCNLYNCNFLGFCFVLGFFLTVYFSCTVSPLGLSKYFFFAKNQHPSVPRCSTCNCETPKPRDEFGSNTQILTTVFATSTPAENWWTWSLLSHAKTLGHRGKVSGWWGKGSERSQETASLPCLVQGNQRLPPDSTRRSELLYRAATLTQLPILTHIETDLEE